MQERYPCLCMTAALEHCPEAVTVTDKRGVIQFVNDAFVLMTGFSSDEAVGKDVHLLDSGRQGMVFFSGVREKLAQSGSWSGRMINRKKDGTHYTEQCTLSPLKTESGNIAGYLSYRSDVMERLRLETVAAESLSARNADYIAAGIRHELGNAVNTLDITLSVLKAKIEHLEKSDVMNYLDRALEHSSKVAHLLRVLKTGALFGTPELQDVRLHDFLKEFLNLVRADFSAKGILIDVTIDDGAGLCVADPRSLYHVLLNLLINAADALVGTRQPRIGVGVFREGKSVHIRIEDNGSGMTDREQRNLFKPFYSTKSQGTGLGLVLVQKLLSAMNGFINIRSAPNKGTVVDVSLPVGSAAVSRRSPATINRV